MMHCYAFLTPFNVCGRLESRQAAEEIVERLHGRMVRGWKDAGSRISVRFADTSEQRELRVSPVLCTFDVITVLITLLARGACHP